MWFLIFPFLLGAQRITQENIEAKGIKAIEINTDEVYQISITAAKVKNIILKTHSEGEYYNDIIIRSAVREKRLILTSEYPDILTGGFDKLSAHKVFSVEIELIIPEDLEVFITSNIASVIAKGGYKYFYADLQQGYCHLLTFNGNATINTYKGDIIVETQTGLIEANTRNGELLKPSFLPGRNPLRLNSLDGDIIVRKN
ncbi:hypothetical protein LPB144_10975 [Christiangramia salexigens]|uniref:Adhesin domain-containing protein n=2 Tax=Christiangramia salexigens TaxID=1913577 RepID=A0A1L3J6Z6_9FLAO|nr:hypothetical protein LPB144_10975 [Christiangramia salexigens]